MCCKDNWRHQKDFKNAILKQKPQSIENATINKLSPAPMTSKEGSFPLKVSPPKPRNVAKDVVVEKSKPIISSRVSVTDNNSNKLVQTDKLPPKPKKENPIVRKRNRMIANCPLPNCSKSTLWKQHCLKSTGLP
ncbi:schwannomin-interacting protein 1 [Caerostris extrusa]|uniref:Schwannomin-interacting protein 1 n=1 Tax=Caerostris extrusa TaxID=172846 RepID=A0AAV4Y045_CAEEX|nr:schwannomin-interacting protein 1 [Caerostris extrusa]